uniref:Ovule protein n=1 Tax=Heterorhabditis bacteriophora TaxID=37862 RepID=A0A1I7X926_HETBA
MIFARSLYNHDEWKSCVMYTSIYKVIERANNTQSCCGLRVVTQGTWRNKKVLIGNKEEGTSLKMQ